MLLRRFLLFFLIIPSPYAAWAAAHVLTNRVGPSDSQLYIADADGSSERRLLANGQFDYDASFSADGQWIVFTSERSGSADIYRVHTDGSGLERVVGDPAFDDQAALSPDGRQLAFVSTRGAGTANIWILDLDTHRTRNLTGSPSFQAPAGERTGFFRPAWSPDGRWIAFSSDRGSGFRPREAGFEHLQDSGVYIVRPDGSALRRLTLASEFAGSPKWSIDGAAVLFYSMAADDTWAARSRVISGPSPAQIVSIDIATGARLTHTTGSMLKVSPQFIGPERIAYLVKGGSREGQITFAGAEKESSPTRSSGAIRNPAWSPDGAHVVYQKFVYDSRQGQSLPSHDHGFDLAFSGEFPSVSGDGAVAMSPFGDVAAGTAVLQGVAIYSAAVDGSGLKKIFGREEGAAYAPAWSPDGQWIAFGFGTLFETSKPARLMVMRADGSEPRDLPTGPGNAGFPSWSPDGKRLVYRVWSKQERGLRVLDITSGSIQRLTMENDNFPKWSPTGDNIAFTRNVGGTNSYEIFTIAAIGSRLRRLTNSPGNDAHSAWSPDGKSLLFSSSRLGFRDEAPLYDNLPQPYAELFVMRFDGTRQHAITDDKWEQGTPAWIPGPQARQRTD